MSPVLGVVMSDVLLVNKPGELPPRFGVQCVMNCVSEDSEQYEAFYWELKSDGQVRMFDSITEANEYCRVLNDSYYSRRPSNKEVRDIFYRVIQVRNAR